MKHRWFLAAFLALSLALISWQPFRNADARSFDNGAFPASNGQQYPGGPNQTIVKCESNNGKLRYCPIGDARQSVELVTQMSSSPCVRGQTWGNDNRGIWVDRGCRAQFRVIAYGGSGPSWWDTAPGHKPGGVPRDGACFFTSQNFSGDYFCQSRGASLNVPPGFNDKISSIRVYGRVNVTIYNDANFGGPSVSLRQSVPDLRTWNYAGYNNKSWNNRITSVRVN
jgi:DUF3011 family protein/peptidase inhibitor family I36